MSSNYNPDLITHEDFIRESDRVQRLVYGLVGNTALADDILQEAWVRALEKPPKQNVAVGSWFARVARNLAVDWFRREGKIAKRREHSEPDGEGVDSDPQAAASQVETSYLLLKAVGNLSDPYRTVISLHYLEGFTVAEVARETGVPDSTVRTQLMRGRERLEASLNQSLGSQWQAQLLLAFPMIQPLVPNIAAAAAEMGGVFGGMKSGTASGAMSQKTAWMLGGVLLVVTAASWVWLTKPDGGSEANESVLASDTIQQGEDGHGQVAARTNSNRLGDLGVERRIAVSDPLGLIEGAVEVNAYLIGQRLVGAAWDAPLDALEILDRHSLTATADNIVLPPKINDSQWMLQVRAPGVASQRLEIREGELVVEWQPIGSRNERFQVQDRGGFGVAGALVFIGARNNVPRFPVQWQIADANGWVEFDDLPKVHLRCIAIHSDGGFESIDEKSMKDLSKQIGHGVLPLNTASILGIGVHAQQIFDSSFPFGSGANHFHSFLSMLANFVVRLDRAEVTALSADADPKQAPYQIVGQVLDRNGGVPALTTVLVELADSTMAKGRLDQQGRLHMRARLPFQRLAVLNKHGYVRIDRLEASNKDPNLVDVGVLKMTPMDSAEVVVIGEQKFEDLKGGLTRPSKDQSQAYGPTLPVPDWRMVLVQSMQWIKPQRPDHNSLRFLAPGADLLGTAWVQLDQQFAHNVTLSPGQVTQFEPQARPTVEMIANTPLDVAGEEFCLIQNRQGERFTGLRPDGSTKRIVAKLQADERTLVFENVPPGSFSLDTIPVAEEAFTLHSFLVGADDLTENFEVRGVGEVEVTVSPEWRGNAWMRISDPSVIGKKAPQSTKRIVFGWNGTQKLKLREGEFEMLVQLGDSPPFWRSFTIAAGQTTPIQIEEVAGEYPLRIIADGNRKLKRAVLAYRGINRVKWFHQRGTQKLPSGGLVATNHSIYWPQAAGVIKDLDVDPVFNLGFVPEHTIHLMVLDEFGIWSEALALEPGQFRAEQELVVYPKWPNSIVLRHPSSWGKWVEVRVSGSMVESQILRQLLPNTPLSLSGSGDVDLRFSYSDGEGGTTELERTVQVDPNDTTPLYFDVPLPE